MINRRESLKTGMAGIAFLSPQASGCGRVGSGKKSGDELSLIIGAALFEMVDGRSVFMWTFEDPQGGPRMPGPVIRVTEGRRVRISITNTLKEDHAFAVPGVVSSGAIPPGATATVIFTAPAAGTYLYLDPLNAPVNRVLGLHGAMIVMPKEGNTPYSVPTPAVQQLFDDLGRTDHFPRHLLTLAGWQRERTRIWLMHQIDPLFNSQAEADFLADRPATVSADQLSAGFLPRYFTINGKSGAFASHDPDIALKGRIGQPMLVRILNAGLFTHSNHLHGNHFYVTAVNNTVQEKVLFLDTFPLFPGDRVDLLVPDIPSRNLIPHELALVVNGTV